MDGALTLRFSTQAQMDIQRMTRELSDLQRQVASGLKANDLRGFGDGAARLINTQGLKADADARAAVVGQIEARFGVQASALGHAAESNNVLAQAIRDAISSDDGRGLEVDLQLGLTGLISAMNETWNGRPLFAGERQDVTPIRITSLNELLVATTPAQLFNEADRHQTLDIGLGPPIALANKASEISQGSFDAMRDMKILIDASGGQLDAPLTDLQRDQLRALADRFDDAANTFASAEGRAGQLQQRFASEHTRLQDRSNLFLKEIGDQADADLAQVSVRISALLVQYEAAAKTFTDLSNLTLLDYL